MKVKVFAGAAIAAFVLCGCGEDNVKIVKEYTLPQQKSMTIAMQSTALASAIRYLGRISASKIVSRW
ncbi:hypothetical protein [uncultured Campylobacter sp.]|mgnify:CR=1 FL=1|uniref:hypothetical protein n=1 Tax=uncultured Campylobacter sp. TaxID=218934 RepID=UPI0026286079|nr:hypothetical protein [uncultured Campylobacter sp.]